MRENPKPTVISPWPYDESSGRPPDGTSTVIVAPTLERPSSLTPLKGQNISRGGEMLLSILLVKRLLMLVRSFVRRRGGVESDVAMEVPIEVPNETPIVSETNLYGPWMLVESRRRRVTNMVRQGEALNDNRVQIQGSRYGVLDQVIPETQVEGDDRHGYSNLVEQVASKILPAMSSPTARNGQDIAGSSDMSKGVTRNAAYLKLNPEKKKTKAK
ncbi:hypothetical protein V6N13_133156 [Hibiscus sabdariffa]